MFAHEDPYRALASRLDELVGAGLFKLGNRQVESWYSKLGWETC